MLIAYRPELENPPREAGFGIMKKLMAIGAIEEMKEQVMVEDLPETVQSLSELPLTQAIRAIELIHDADRLADWKKIEGRIRVRNAIAKRVEAIRVGKA